MRTTAVSGAASGIGAATRARLEASGDRVIGIDVRDAEVMADLSAPKGRGEAVAAVLDRCGGRLDRLVLCAGLGPQAEPTAIVSVNYFGAVELLDGLRDALAQGESPAAIVIASNSAKLDPSLDRSGLVRELLDGDEPAARARVRTEGGVRAYMGSKHAVARAVRRRARVWGEAGVRLNAVSPGPVRTPLLERGLADTGPGGGAAIRALPIPLGRFGEADEIAAVLAFLLGPDAAWIHGVVLTVDGGTDALVNPDRF